MKILFVCTANISRSFFAEMLLRDELGSLGVENIFVSSAGLRAFSGSPPDPHMVSYLLERGIPVKMHESRQILEEDVIWADLILVMEKGHQKIIEATWPEAKGKVKPLGAYISLSLEADDILDPYGQSPYHYRLAQSQITLAVKSLAQELALNKKKERHAKDPDHRG